MDGTTVLSLLQNTKIISFVKTLNLRVASTKMFDKLKTLLLN